MHQYDASPPIPPSTPTKWAPYAMYYQGQTAWYAGTVWRCDVGHTSGAEPSGAPSNNFHLWTPISSASNPYDGSTAISSQQVPSSTYGTDVNQNISQDPFHDTHSIAPPAANRMDSAFGDTAIPSSNSPSVGSSRGVRNRRWDTDMFAERAQEGLRYLTMKEEERKANDKDELKDELKGKRVWRVGGLGMWAYSLNMADEGKKQDVWREWGEEHGKDEWLHAAKTRTDFYNKESRGVKPLFMWKLVYRGGALPFDALPVGHEDGGRTLYAARTWWEKGLHLGKAGPHLVNGVSISYGGAEHSPDVFEVLCGPADPALLKWMTFRHGEKLAVEGWQPLEGGREADGSMLLISKGEWENGDHPGKCALNDDHACIGWGGGELWVRPFQVLAYNDPNRR